MPSVRPMGDPALTFIFLLLKVFVKKKKKKQKIPMEYNFHLNNTERVMQRANPLDIWWTWQLSWKSTLPRGRDCHQSGQGNSVSGQLHSGLWRFLLYYEFPLNHFFFHSLFLKSLILMGSACLTVWKRFVFESFYLFSISYLLFET